MSSQNSANSPYPPKPKATVSSSIVHKPFATGKINIFSPYRHKPNQSSNQANPDKLLLEDSAKIESETPLKSEANKFIDPGKNWLDILVNPWSISAIALILLANLISGAAIWRNYQLANNKKVEPTLTNLGSGNLANQEFMPLNLSTLSVLDSSGVTPIEQSSLVEPIPPALAPINSTLDLTARDAEYHYVLTEYSGDRSLALARQKASQVSLVSFPQGVFIYLGAFKEREQAEQFIVQLKQENFAAQIYPFQ